MKAPNVTLSMNMQKNVYGKESLKVLLLKMDMNYNDERYLIVVVET